MEPNLGERPDSVPFQSHLQARSHRYRCCICLRSRFGRYLHEILLSDVPNLSEIVEIKVIIVFVDSLIRRLRQERLVYGTNCLDQVLENYFSYSLPPRKETLQLQDKKVSVFLRLAADELNHYDILVVDCTH